MSRTLRISGVDHRVSPHIHRRMSAYGWSISLPGYDKLYLDKDYGNTSLSLNAATADLASVLKLDFNAVLPHCKIEIDVINRGGNIFAYVAFESACFVKSKHFSADIHDAELGRELYQQGRKILLSSDDAELLIGWKQQEALLQEWVSTMRHHVVATNITKIKLPPARKAPAVYSPLPTPAPVQTSFW